jgi:hypothetical protein
MRRNGARCGPRSHAHAGQQPAVLALQTARLCTGAVRQRARERVQHGRALAGRRAAQRVEERALLLGRPGAGLPGPARRAVCRRGIRQPCGWVPSRSSPCAAAHGGAGRVAGRRAPHELPVQPERGRSLLPRRPCPARGRATRTEATCTEATGGLAVGPVVDAQWRRGSAGRAPGAQSCESRACTAGLRPPPPGGVRAPRQPPQGGKAANAHVLHGAERLVTGPKTDPHSKRVEPQGHH